jgi:hypothetical protein
LQTVKAPPPAPAPPDLHAAPTVLHAAPTVLLGGASARDTAEPAWAAAPVALAPGVAPAAAVPTPSQSLTTVPTTGRGRLVAVLVVVCVVILATVLAWYFTR